MAPSEKVATASMLEDRMASTCSTDSPPRRSAIFSGTKGCSSEAASAATTEKAA